MLSLDSDADLPPKFEDPSRPFCGLGIGSAHELPPTHPTPLRPLAAGVVEALLLRLVAKSIERVSKRSGGLATLVSRHQLRFKLQSEMRQLGSNGATRVD
jgi:hypothetical protein